ncbi:MAG: hypothetical protein US49_C0001G0177 [candidate division TM6 bacterium GW2011_GWF2_37_49]|nr:MAG: hypothetical protein US49_C0001G0177 [candidate division TM6 bacterium GW2011_GWF2_37_49]
MVKIKNSIVFVIFLFFTPIVAIDPFSKILITSEKAVCKKDDSAKNVFLFNYLGNVVVTLADGSKITAKSLEITLDGKGIKVFDGAASKPFKHKKGKHKNKSDKNTSHVKKIIFKNNVKIFNNNRQASSDSAEIDMQENTCKLIGNVKIIQNKTSEKKDIPLNIQSSCALINLKTSEITLLGSSKDPVSTIVELGKEILSPGRKNSKNE